MTVPDEQPIPPRYWWLKRIALASTILIVALVALRWWWGYEAHRRLQAEIDRIVAAGEPIHPEDFDSKNTVPDDQNAVKALEEADSSQASLSDEESATIGGGYVGAAMTPKWDMIHLILDKNRAALAKLRTVQKRPAIEWDVHPHRDDLVASFLPSLSGIRNLSKLARANSLYQHRIGNDAAAVESLLAIRWIAEILYRHPALITQLVGEASDGLLCDTIERIHADLEVASNPSNEESASHPAARNEVAKLIESLGSHSRSVAGMEDSLGSERMLQLGLLEQSKDGTMTIGSLMTFFDAPRLPGFMYGKTIEPLLDLDTLKTIQWTGRQIDLVRSGSWSKTKSFDIAIDRESSAGAAFLFPFFSMDISSLERAIALHFKARALRQLAAAALAIRLYQLDQDGERPRELAGLVPDYLPDLPLDPFADGKPLGYRPTAEPPFLYTVHEDGLDQGGKYKLGSDGSIDYPSFDWPYFLAAHA